MFGPGGNRAREHGLPRLVGGFRTSSRSAPSDTTPGYLPGPIDRGRWNVMLGPYQVSPAGVDYTVTVRLTYGPPLSTSVPQYPPQQVAGSRAGWYRGDCHLHTVHSDGRRLPSEVAAGARAAGLDFIVSTDHNTPSSHAVWGPLSGPDLLIVTVGGGHHPQRSRARARCHTGALDRLAVPRPRRSCSTTSPAPCTATAAWSCRRTRVVPTWDAAGSSATTTPTRSRCGTVRGR